MNVLVLGPAGAGKTTLILDYYAGTHHVVDVRDYVLSHWNGEGTRDEEEVAIRDAYARLANDLPLILDKQEPVVVEVALDWPEDTLPPVLDALSPDLLHVVWEPLEECLKRNETRDRSCPPRVIRHHHEHDAFDLAREIHRERGVPIAGGVFA